MRFTGTLTTWNDQKGFGFITPTSNSTQIFVHITAFPRDGLRPCLNELLSYESEVGKNGKLQAVRVQRFPNSPSRHSAKQKDEKTSLLGLLILFIIAGSVAVFAYQHYSNYSHRIDLERNAVDPISIPAGCDGRTMCSEMTSCTEATWFINNCPSTTMDGNHDGTPCEMQWCTKN